MQRTAAVGLSYEVVKIEGILMMPRMMAREYNIAFCPVTDGEFSIDNPYLREILDIRERLKGENVADISAAFLEYRPELIARYAFSIPLLATLRRIAGFSPLVEVGAGTGYWAMCLDQLGAEIDAYDLQPPDENSPFAWSDGNYWFDESWYAVQEGDETVAACCPERTLFLCWPMPESPMALQALEAYREAGGGRMIYIGDPRSSGGEDFHDALASLTIIENRRLWSWPVTEERLIIATW